MSSSTTLVIDISDSGILISNSEKILIDSPSCALIDSDNSIIIGQTALAQAHLRPLDTCTSYWTQLTQNSTTKYVVSHAEIAYRHLALVWKQLALDNADAIIIVPNTYSKQALGLLLGICNKLSISIFALLSNSVLAHRNPSTPCIAIHLDIMQQNIVLNEIEHDDKKVSAKQVNKTLPYGLDKLNTNIAKSIAKKFIQKTRYDPLHSAEDEQEFFNALPQWLAQLKHDDTLECTLNSNAHNYKINLTRDDVADANQLAFNEIALSLSSLLQNNESNILIICSPNCKNVFSLIEFLKSLPGCAVSLLDKNSLAEQALSLKDHVLHKQQQVHYTTSLNWHENTSNVEIQFNEKSLRHLNSIPTHILFDHNAYFLTEETFINNIKDTNKISMSNRNNDHAICKIATNGYLKEISKLNSTKVKINNELIEENCFVSLGDTLSIGDSNLEYRFIKVTKYEA